jgi:hypothetical protein
MKSDATLTEILPLARAGWRLFPVAARQKTPAVGDWPTVATTDEMRLREWQDAFPSCGWACVTGAASGVWVLDVDGEAGNAWCAEQTRLRGDGWTQTRKVKTNRGFHLYFRWPGNGVNIRNSANRIASGVDTRGEGGYVVIPPSVHPDGSGYAWLGPPTLAPIFSPQWLLALATNASQLEASPATGDVSGVIPQGERNSTLASLAGSMRRRGMSQDAIAAGLLAENKRACNPPLPQNEVEKIAESVSRYEPQTLRVRPIRSASSVVDLLRSENGIARGCVANVVALLRESPEWQGVIGFDEFAERVVMHKAAPGFPPDQRPYPREWSDDADVHAMCWLQRAGVILNSGNTVAAAIQAVARDPSRRFHPVRDYLNGLRWDGTERADHWLTDCFAVEESDYVRAVSRRWLISACARAFAPGCQVDHSLLLIGRQGVGKSSGLRALVPRSEWFADSIATLGSRDSRLELRGKWIVELSELSALRRAEVEAVKSFLSERIDHYRAPYARNAVDVPRASVFAGSTNDDSPLLDSENRRFWPVRVGKVDVKAIEEFRDQLWAEAVVYFKRGDPWWLDSEKLKQAATEAQKNAYSPGPWDEIIRDWIERPEVRTGATLNDLPWAGSAKGWINLGDAAIHGIGIEPNSPHLDQARKSVARLLRHLGYSERQEGKAGRFRGKRYYAKGAE